MPVIVGAETPASVPGVGPRLAAVAAPEATPPSVRVDVDGFGSTATTVLLSRLNADGSTVPVRQPVALVRGAGTVFDPEAPFGEPVSYFEAESGASSDTVVVDADVPWLVNPFRPGDSIAVLGASKREPEFDAASFRERQHGTSRVLVQPYGPRPPIVVTTGGRRSLESEMTVRTRTEGQMDQLLGLINTDEVLFLNVPPRMGLGLSSAYLSIGNVTEGRRATWGDDPVRNWVMPYTHVQYPFGSVSPAWNIDSFDEVFGSIDDIAVSYRSLENAELNVRRDLGVPAG